MKSIFITFRSITLAQRAQRVLKNAGVECVLQRTPRWMEERGCGYSLRLRGGDMRRCLELLTQNGVAYSKVYAQTDQGMEELAP